MQLPLREERSCHSCLNGDARLDVNITEHVEALKPAADALDWPFDRLTPSRDPLDHGLLGGFRRSAGLEQMLFHAALPDGLTIAAARQGSQTPFAMSHYGKGMRWNQVGGCVDKSTLRDGRLIPFHGQTGSVQSMTPRQQASGDQKVDVPPQLKVGIR